MLKKKNSEYFRRNKALHPGAFPAIHVVSKHAWLVFFESLGVSPGVTLPDCRFFLDLSENFAFNQPRWISTFMRKNDHVSTKFNITFQKNLRVAEICTVEHSLAIRDQLSTLTSYGNYYDVIVLV